MFRRAARLRRLIHEPRPRSPAVADGTAAGAAQGTALIEPGKPWQNGVAESFNGKFRDECLSLEWFRSRAEAKVVIEKWRQHYNEIRPHSSLDYLTPNEFVARAARPAPHHATGRDAAVCGASAPRPVAQSPHQGQMQQAGIAVSS
jgi:putative transposase